MFPVLTGRTAHIAFENLTIVGRRGKSNHAGCFCNALSAHQKGQAALNAEKQNIFEDRHFHIFFEKAAAFTLADIDVGGYVIQGNLLAVMFLKIGQDVF